MWIPTFSDSKLRVSYNWDKSGGSDTTTVTSWLTFSDLSCPSLKEEDQCTGLGQNALVLPRTEPKFHFQRENAPKDITHCHLNKKLCSKFVSVQNEQTKNFKDKSHQGGTTTGLTKLVTATD